MPNNNSDEETMFQTVVSDCNSPARLIELHYFASEPHILTLFRAIGRMQEQDRAMLEAFLLTHGHAAIRCSNDHNDRLQLTVAQKEAGRRPAAPRYLHPASDERPRRKTGLR